MRPGHRDIICCKRIVKIPFTYLKYAVIGRQGTQPRQTQGSPAGRRSSRLNVFAPRVSSHLEQPVTTPGESAGRNA